MRYRILASFQGAPYEAGVGPDESDVVLFAACPPPEELRFEPATGHWRKRVSRDQVQMLYESRPIGMFRGERCIVLDDLSDRLHIVYLGHDALRAAQLGYWEVDRGVFELITPRHEVTDIVEQRLPLPSGNGVPFSGGDSQPFEYGSGQDKFATGPQPIDQRASLDGLPSGYSQDLPSAGLGRADPRVLRSADQSDVAIPAFPEPPLPLEAEALKAASSAARRGQKSSQSRQEQDARVARRPSPAVEPVLAASAPAAETTIEPAETTIAQVQATIAPVSAAAAPPGVPITEVEVLEPAAEVSQPLPTPVPAAAMLSKAAMLSHAAAMAARQAAPSSKQSEPPTAPAAASGEHSTRSEQESQPRAETEQPGSTPDRTALAPEPASLPPEPAPLAPEQVGVPAVGVPAIAEAAVPVGRAADAPRR